MQRQIANNHHILHSKKTKSAKRTLNYKLLRIPLLYLNTLIIILMLSACAKEEFSHCEESTSLYQYSDFPIGVAVSTDLLQYHDRYRDITKNQFNRISGERAWLYYKVHPEQNTYNWHDYDILVDFAETQNKEIIGHSLVYHAFFPNWLENFSGSKADWELLLKDHIQTIVSKYKGKIDAWIVVNEAFNEDGTLRNSVWHKHIGPSYIQKAFEWAHEANPNAILFYNDYNLALNRNKLDAVIALLRTFKNNAVPIHGLGCQLHIFEQFPEVSEINDMALKIQENDLLVYYSEIDISLNPYGKLSASSNEMLMRQKNKLKAIVKGYKRLDKKYQYGISFWNVADADTWIRSYFNRMDWPCMWDDNYQPKPMYCGIKEAL